MDYIYEVTYVPPTRELDLFASMGSKQGAAIWRDPSYSALQVASSQFIDDRNDRCQPVTWTKSDDELPPKIKWKETSRAGR